MAKQINCPRCGNPTVFSPENPHRPFCSERCRMIDLGAWAEGSYRVPTADHTPGAHLTEDDDHEETD